MLNGGKTRKRRFRLRLPTNTRSSRNSKMIYQTREWCFRLRLFTKTGSSFGRTMRCLKGCKQNIYMKPMLLNISKCLNRVATNMGLQKVFPSFWPPLPSSVKAEKFGNRFAIRFSGEVFAPQHVTVRTDCQDIVCVNVTYER